MNAHLVIALTLAATWINAGWYACGIGKIYNVLPNSWGLTSILTILGGPISVFIVGGCIARQEDTTTTTRNGDQ